jgi:hypothetical protein
MAGSVSVPARRRWATRRWRKTAGSGSVTAAASCSSSSASDVTPAGQLVTLQALAGRLKDRLHLTAQSMPAAGNDDADPQALGSQCPLKQCSL